jgi:hypothetical protein
MRRLWIERIVVGCILDTSAYNQCCCNDIRERDESMDMHTFLSVRDSTSFKYQSKKYETQYWVVSHFHLDLENLIGKLIKSSCLMLLSFREAVQKQPQYVILRILTFCVGRRRIWMAAKAARKRCKNAIARARFFVPLEEQRDSE